MMSHLPFCESSAYNFFHSLTVKSKSLFLKNKEFKKLYRFDKKKYILKQFVLYE